MIRANTLKKLLANKKIGTTAAVILLFNAGTGPAIPFTPAIFSNPGYLPTTLAFLLFTMVSGFSCLFIIEAMQSIPGNSCFQGEIQFGTLINFYFGPVTHGIGQLLLYFSIISNIIQGIVLASQSIDWLIIDLFSKTCGLTWTFKWICTARPIETSLPSPFELTFMVFTLGLLVVVALSLPLGLSNLDDNLFVQYFAFAVSLLIGIQWISSSPSYSILRIPAATDFTRNYKNYGCICGTIMLNLSLTTIIPTWINIKKSKVNAQKTVWSALSVTCAYYVILGLFLAAAFDTDLSQSNEGNILTILNSKGIPPILTKISVYAFTFFMLIPSIPVNMIIAKQNLSQTETPMCIFKK